jgi:acetyl esterase/lipase
MIHRRTFLGGSLAMLAASTAQAQWGAPPTNAVGDPDAPAWPPPERFALWPGSPPGAPRTPIKPDWTMNGPKGERQLWLRGIAVPEVSVFRPARPDGSALLAIPGGGYGFVSVQNEGLEVAQRFNSDRMTVFVLTYRLPGEGWSNRHLVPLQDAQRAMRLIRSRAESFRIDPSRLGVIGFSAGGHLAADLAVAHAEPTYARVDRADDLSARPAYAGLLYPVTTLIDPGGSSQSMSTLLGPSPTSAMLKARSPVLHVTKDTPPTFLAHAMDDPVVPPDHSLRWAEAARKAGAPVDLHIFAQGNHGFGLLAPRDLPASRWPEMFSLFLRRHGG